MNSALVAIYLAASAYFSLPPGLLSAVCFVESSHRPHVVHKDDGRGDSMGVCQVQPATAKDMGYTGAASGLLKPEVNAFYAAKYLRKQLNRYGGDMVKAVAAYNAGTYRENKFGKPINQKYVEKVVKAWEEGR